MLDSAFRSEPGCIDSTNLRYGKRYAVELQDFLADHEERKEECNIELKV